MQAINVYNDPEPKAGSRRVVLRLDGLASLSGLGLATPFLLAGCGGSSTSEPGYAAALQEAQTAAQEVLRQGSATSLGIALVSAERMVWAESYRYADLDKQQAPTTTTMFCIGSSSKIFATVAVMQLVEQSSASRICRAQRLLGACFIN